MPQDILAIDSHVAEQVQQALKGEKANEIMDLAMEIKPNHQLTSIVDLAGGKEETQSASPWLTTATCTILATGLVNMESQIGVTEQEKKIIRETINQIKQNVFFYLKTYEDNNSYSPELAEVTSPVNLEIWASSGAREHMVMAVSEYHEYMHLLQRRQADRVDCPQALIEGTADFLTDQAFNGNMGMGSLSIGYPVEYLQVALLGKEFAKRVIVNIGETCLTPYSWESPAFQEAKDNFFMNWGVDPTSENEEAFMSIYEESEANLMPVRTGGDEVDKINKINEALKKMGLDPEIIWRMYMPE